MRSRSAHTYSRRFDRIRPLRAKHSFVEKKRKAARSVIVTRPESVSTALRTKLAARGRPLLVQPLLRITPLPASIPALDGFQGVIASSAAAVEILAAQNPSRTCAMFVVGNAGRTAAANAGYSNIQAAPNATGLADLIRSALSPADGPLLYIAGVHRARDMRRLLSAFQVELVEVYAAAKVLRLDASTSRALKRGQIASIAFYSVRAADAFNAAARHAGVAKEARLATAHCLSRRIAARLQARGWRRTWASGTPAAELIDARLLGMSASRNTIATAMLRSLHHSSSPSPAQAAVPEASMKSPAPTPPAGTAKPVETGKPAATAKPAETVKSVETTKPAITWPPVIGVAVLAALFAGVAWYLSKDRVEGLQAEVASLRERLASIDMDPGKADRAALVARSEEASKVSTALAAVAANAADKASVEQVVTRVQDLDGKVSAALSALGTKTDAAIAELEQSTSAAAQSAQIAAKAAETQTAAQTKTIEGVTAQIAALEKRFATIEAWTKGASPAQLAERLIALSELRRVLNKGVPFASALARAQASLPDVTASAGGWLDRAGTGIATYPQLAAALARIEKELPAPKSNASSNSVVNSALGVLLSGIQVEGEGALVDDPNRNAVAAARQALATGEPAAAVESLTAIAGNVKAVDDWKAELAARIDAEAAISSWEKKVLATVGESVQ